MGSSNDKLGMEIANDNTTTINLPLSLKLITSIIVCLFPKSNPCCIINFLLDSDYLIFMNQDLWGFFFGSEINNDWNNMKSWLINWDAIWVFFFFLLFFFLPPRFAKLHGNIQSGRGRNSTLPKAMQGQKLIEVLITNTKRDLGFIDTFPGDRLLMGISLQTESVHPQTY